MSKKTFGRFTAVVEFTDDENGSMYLPGMNYTIRTQALLKKVETWRGEGKVDIIETAPAASIKGEGKVK